MSDATLIDGFLGCSAELTGFSVFELRATGEAEAYLETTLQSVGQELLQDLVDAYSNLNDDAKSRNDEIRRDILADPRLGPVARNLIKMWFSGVWYQLPQYWIADYGSGASNTTHTVRPSSYPEGLLWKTIGANPPGARAPGYGSWAEAPTIPDPDQGVTLLKARN
jgi:hypothetical protein